MLVKKKLRKNALSYLKAVLDNDNYLCRCLKEHLSLFRGNAFSFLPENLDVAKIKDFKSGGLFLKVENYLSKYILDKYNKDDNVFVLFDDVMANPTDEYLELDNKDTFFIFKNSVFHYVNLLDTDNPRLSKTIWATNVSWHFLCVIIKCNEKSDKDEFLKKFSCDFVIKNSVELVVGAFDGEGFIHIEKNQYNQRVSVT